MKLRSCANFHFIQSLKDGLVVKAPSVYHGKPALKFKGLKDIYEAEDENKNPNDELEGFLSDSNMIKFERPVVSDSEFSNLSSNEDDRGRDSESDGDFGIGMITLKQLKEKCKVKKRKRAKLVDFRAVELCSRLKEDIEEDECYMTKPLITWKRSKKVKDKKECLKNQISTSRPCALSKVKAEHISAEKGFTTSTERLPVCGKVKIEALELTFSDYRSTIDNSSLISNDQVVSFTDSQKSRDVAKMAGEGDLEFEAYGSDGESNVGFMSDSSLICNDAVDHCDELSSEAPIIGTEDESSIINNDLTNDCEEFPIEIATELESSLTIEDQVGSWGKVLTESSAMDTDCRSSLNSDNKSDSFGIEWRVATKESTEYNMESQTLTALTKESQHSVIEDTLNRVVDSCGAVPREVTEIASECFPRTYDWASDAEISQTCALNESCYDYLDHAHSETGQSIRVSCVDVKKVENREADINLELDFYGSESALKGHAGQASGTSVYEEPVLPISDCSADISNVFLSSSSKHAIPCDDDCYVKVLQQIDSKFRRDLCAMDDHAKDDPLSSPKTNCIYTSCEGCKLDCNGCLITSLEDSPKPAEKQSQTCAFSDNCLPQKLDNDTFEKLNSTDADNDCCTKLDPSPQRLLSTRKAMSPDSQVKLCKAMESIDIQGEEHLKPQKKLRFPQQNGDESKVDDPERTDRITKIRFSVSHEKNIVKPKYEKRNAQAGVVPDGVPRFTTGCNSIESCRQSAIAFSQRQMQDIECLVLKLANELKSMKEIAEDRLHYEASPSSSSKYKPNEVRLAVKSATRVEQVTTKWLSMMTRDCNRFCKIMTMSEKGSNASETERVKEKKRITFADETGEKLCHVRFFEKNSLESLESETEKYDH